MTQIVRAWYDKDKFMCIPEDLDERENLVYIYKFAKLGSFLQGVCRLETKLAVTKLKSKFVAFLAAPVKTKAGIFGLGKTKEEAVDDLVSRITSGVSNARPEMYEPGVKY